MALLFECCLCEVRVLGLDTLRSHVAGKQHAVKAHRYGQGGLSRNHGPSSVRCVMCNVVLPNVEKVVEHLQSASVHQSPAAGDSAEGGKLWTCNVCEVTVSGTVDNANSHKAGKQHMAAVGRRMVMAGVSGTLDGIPTPGTSDTPQVCRVCNVTISGAANMRQHLAGKQHASKVRQVQQVAALPTGLPGSSEHIRCNTCNIFVTSLENLEQHCSGRQHILNLATANSGSASLAVAKASPVSVLGTPGKLAPAPLSALGTPGKLAPAPLSALGTPGKLAPAAGSGGTYCSTCNIRATSADGLQAHLDGKPHAKKLKTLGAGTQRLSLLQSSASNVPSGETGPATGATGKPTGVTGTATGATGIPTGVTGTATGATGILSVDSATSSIPSTLAGTTTVTLASSGSDMPSSSKPLPESGCSRVVADDSNPLHCAVFKTGFATQDEMAAHCEGREHMTSRMLAAMARNLNPAYSLVLAKRDDEGYEPLSKLGRPEGSGTQNVNPPSTAELLVDASMESSENANNNESDSDEDVIVQRMVEDEVFGWAESSLFSEDKRRDCMERRKAYKACRRQIKAQNKNQETSANSAYTQYILADDEVRKLKEEISQQVRECSLVCKKIIREKVAVVEDIG